MAIEDFVKQANQELNQRAQDAKRQQADKEQKAHDERIRVLQEQVERELPTNARDELQITYGFEKEAIAKLKARDMEFVLSKPPALQTVWNLSWPGHMAQLDTKKGPLQFLLFQQIGSAIGIK